MLNSVPPISLYSPRRSIAGLTLFFVILLVASIVFGLVASLGSVRLAVIFGGGAAAIGIFFLSANHIIILLVVLSFLVVGQVFYFGGYGQAFWIPYGIGLLLFIKLALLNANREKGQGVSSLFVFAILSIVSALMAYAVNLSPIFQALAGGKNLLALWSVFFIIAAGFVSQETVARIWKLFFWVLLFQVPLVLYQYFVVAPSRTTFGITVGGVEWDAIIGGFGGNPEGGGASGVLAYFACLMVALAIAGYRHRVVGKMKLFITLAAAALCLALAEVKVAIVLLPVALLAILMPDARKRPWVLIIGVPVALVIGFSVLVAYERFHYRTAASQVSTPAEILEKAFGYSIDPHLINYRTGEMGRTAALIHWWDEVMMRDAFHAVLGHGPGASRGRSIVGAGEAAKNYPFLIDRSAATQLLWDTGLLGFLSYFLALLVGTIHAARLSVRPGLSNQEATLLKATTAGLAMSLIMLFYGRDLLEVPALSLLVMMMLGQVAWYSAHSNQTKGKEVAHTARTSSAVIGVSR
jgi:hypothetical protein